MPRSLLFGTHSRRALSRVNALALAAMRRTESPSRLRFFSAAVPKLSRGSLSLQASTLVIAVSPINLRPATWR